MTRLAVGWLVGLFMAALFMAYLAQRASFVFFQSIREGSELEEDMAAFCTRHAGAMNEAALHHANVLAAKDSTGWWAWDEVPRRWTFMRPVESARRGWLTANQEIFVPIVRDHPELAERIDGMYHGLLADELEKAARHAEAGAEDARAVDSLGDVDHVREHPPAPTVHGILCRSTPPYTRGALERLSRLDPPPTR